LNNLKGKNVYSLEVHMIDCIEKNDVTPVCPHCNASVNTIGFRKVESLLGKRYIYFCINCKKVLGISHRKGFWMG
jgi:hypothetical protein